MCCKQCKCLIVQWRHACSSYSSVVYDANRLRCVSLHGFWKQDEFSTAVSELWSVLESSINYCVWARGSRGRGGPPARRELSGLLLFGLMYALGSLLDHSRPVKRPTLWSKYNSQHSAHKNLGIRQRRFFSFCGRVAVETDNKGQPSTSGIIV